MSPLFASDTYFSFYLHSFVNIWSLVKLFMNSKLSMFIPCLQLRVSLLFLLHFQVSACEHSFFVYTWQLVKFSWTLNCQQLFQVYTRNWVAFLFTPNHLHPTVSLFYLYTELSLFVIIFLSECIPVSLLFVCIWQLVFFSWALQLVFFMSSSVSTLSH